MAVQSPNPIEVYQGAVELILPAVAGIGENHFGLDTPCSEWTVQALINHNLAVQAMTHGVLLKSGAGTPPDLTAALPEGAEAPFRAVTAQVLAALQAVDLEEMVESPFGPIAAGRFIMFPIADLVIHKWDLAKATGQNTDIDSSLAEICLQTLTPAVAGGRENGAFGLEVTVPSAASIQDRLLALTGRQP